MKSVEHKEPVEIRDSAYQKTILIRPEKSEKLQFQLFYPDIRTQSVVDPVQDTIIKSLNGFVFQFVESKTQRLMSEYKVELGNKDFRYNFRYSDTQPLALWLGTSVAVEKGESYRIFLLIPEKKEAEIRFNNPLLLIGVGKDVFW